MGASLTIDEYCRVWQAANPGAKQGELARHLGISRPYLSQILAFRKEPNWPLIRRIASMTGGAVQPDSWLRRDRTQRVRFKVGNPSA